MDTMMDIHLGRENTHREHISISSVSKVSNLPTNELLFWGVKGNFSRRKILAYKLQQVCLFWTSYESHSEPGKDPKAQKK